MPVRDLLELLRRQGEALGPNSWNGTRLAKRASERFREIAVIKSRTNRFIWPAAVEQVKSRFVRFKTKDDLLKQVGTALVAHLWPKKMRTVGGASSSPEGGFCVTQCQNRLGSPPDYL